MTDSISDDPTEIPNNRPGEPDVEPDAARYASVQGEWTGEGDATPSGTATNSVSEEDEGSNYE